MGCWGYVVGFKDSYIKIYYSTYFLMFVDEVHRWSVSQDKVSAVHKSYA